MNPQGWHLGYGLVLNSDAVYDGSEDRQLRVLPNININYRDTFTANPLFAEYRFRPAEGLVIAPRISLLGGRDDVSEASFLTLSGGDSDHLKGMDDIPFGIGAGVGVQYDVTRFLRLKTSFRQGIVRQDSLRGEFGFDLRGRYQTPGPPLIWSFGPSVQFANQDYADTFFGVTAEQSRNSGLAEFDADAGVLSYTIGGQVLLPLSRAGDNIIITRLSYTHLDDAIARSPVVTAEGSTSLMIIWNRRLELFQG